MKYGLSHLPVTDCHVHMRGTVDSMVNCAAIMEANKLRGMNIVCVPQLTNEQLTLNPVAMLFKLMHPDQAYVFGGLRYPVDGLRAAKKNDFVDQVKAMMRMGMDGVKMIEGKPTVRKRIGVPLNDPAYHDYYAYLEAEGIPVLLHVGDPWIFWHEATIPQYAREREWMYTDGSFPDNESLYRESEAVLEEFPGLKVIFAHFYFLNSDRERADAFLNRWPNVSFDLTPGIEMFPDFSQDYDAWRELFVKHQDQIILGTDNSGEPRAPNPANVARGLYRLYQVRNFLECDHEFQCWESTARGFALEEPVLEKIYAGNFARYAGESPKKPDAGLILQDCEKAISLATGCSAETLSELHRIRSHVKTFCD